MAYHLGILFHLIGILLMFAALVEQLRVYRAMRTAKNPAQLKTVGKSAETLGVMFGASSGLILLSGIYLSWRHLSHGGAVAWLIIAIITFVLMGAYGAKNGQRNKEKILKVAAAGGTLKLSDTDNAEISISWMMFLSILILMVFQPGLLVSIVIVLICLAVGLFAPNLVMGNRFKI